jgi:hypothetical protein
VSEFERRFMREPRRSNPAADCARYGHEPPLVEHLPDWRTRLTCPHCRKSVIERGLTDHPEAAANGNGER